MTEKEMLEAAAKAAGILLDYELHPEGKSFMCQSRGLATYLGSWWHPGKSNDDALNLAALLRLKIIPGKYSGDGCTVEAQGVWAEGSTSCTAFRKNASEQMRLAILHVASEIGVVHFGYQPEKDNK